MTQENMRASDADREQIVDRLQAAMDEGRLTIYEYDARLKDVYAAKTYGELEPILADLPAQRNSRAGKLGGDAVPQWVVIMWIPWVAVGLLVIGIWLATGLGYFWPGWVIGPWGAALLIPTFIGIVTNRDSGQGRGPHKR
ncbi:DUF1707 SHOCT-like domain-containing protein [Nocardia sp. NPDC003693]